MDPIEQFQRDRLDRLNRDTENERVGDAANRFLIESIGSSYSYNFEWLSRPIIQYPQDIVAIQELIWRVKPDLIIETGIAHGGSLILSASMLALLDYCDAADNATTLNPRASSRRVLGIDIDIRAHNRLAIEKHPLSHKIDLLEASSIARETVAVVRDRAKKHQRIMVLLDSNHTHDHVLAELAAYAPLVSPDSYCVVFDTIIEHLPDGSYPDRPWARGNSPLTAVQSYLGKIATTNVIAEDGDHLRFEVDSAIDSKLLISVAPGGYLRRIKQPT